MITATHQILEDAATGLLYVLHGNDATIVGCRELFLTHLHIPACIGKASDSHPVTAVGESAFAYQTALTTVDLPLQLTFIHHGAFEGSGLTEVTLPDSIRSVASFAFYGCEQLRQVFLPLNAALEEQAFGGCTALTAENVTDIANLSDSERRRAGLPAYPPANAADQASCFQTPAGTPPLTARHLLEKGLELENAGEPIMASIAYWEASCLRPVVNRLTDTFERCEQLRVIAEAEYHLALLLKFRQVPAKTPDNQRLPTAESLLKRLVEAGDVTEAAYQLGDMYASHDSVAVKAAEALRLLKLAAENQHERARLDLGYIYLDGLLGSADADAAAHYFAQCAALDGPLAHIALKELEHLQETR